MFMITILLVNTAVSNSCFPCDCHENGWMRCVNMEQIPSHVHASNISHLDITQSAITEIPYHQFENLSFIITCNSTSFTMPPGEIKAIKFPCHPKRLQTPSHSPVEIVEIGLMIGFLLLITLARLLLPSKSYDSMKQWFLKGSSVNLSNQSQVVSV